MKFNEKLMELRKEKGWSQEELGNKLDVSRQTISKWELAETTPEMDKLLKLGEIFNISIDDLANEKNEQPKEQKQKGIYEAVVLILKVIGITFLVGAILLIIMIIISAATFNNMRVEAGPVEIIESVESE